MNTFHFFIGNEYIRPKSAINPVPILVRINSSEVVFTLQLGELAVVFVSTHKAEPVIEVDFYEEDESGSHVSIVCDDAKFTYKIYHSYKEFKEKGKTDMLRL